MPFLVALVLLMPAAKEYFLIENDGEAVIDPIANLRDNPEVQVQVMGDRFRAKARTATPEEHKALWPRMAQIWPDYDKYQAKTDRQIPLVILERI